jgi:hypothetical protein
VLPDIDGVIKLIPVPKLGPPVAAAYQLIVPADAVAPNVTVPVPQTLPGVDPVIVGIGFTVVAIVLLVAGLPVTHGVRSVNTTLTVLPLVREEVEKVFTPLLVPTFNPLTRH